MSYWTPATARRCSEERQPYHCSDTVESQSRFCAPTLNLNPNSWTGELNTLAISAQAMIL